MNNFYTYKAIFFTFIILPCVALGTDKVEFRKTKYNFYVRNHYTLNLKNSDGLSDLNEHSKYIEYGKGDYDFGISFGYKTNSKFSNEIELRHSSIVPSLGDLREFEMRGFINSLENIIGEKGISVARARRIFAVNRTALFLNYYYNHEINNDLDLMIGGGVGGVAVLNYQGFKRERDRETDIGIGAQFLFALNYKITEQFSLYSGYNYFANYWKYQTNKISDEYGNIMKLKNYDFEDFEFSSHGISLGMIYKF